MYSPYRRSSGTPALRPIQYATLSPMIAPDAAAKMRLAKDACAWLPAITAAVTKTPSLGKGRPMLSSIAAPNTATRRMSKRGGLVRAQSSFHRRMTAPRGNGIGEDQQSRRSRKRQERFHGRGKPIGHASVQQFGGTHPRLTQAAQGIAGQATSYGS